MPAPLSEKLQPVRVMSLNLRFGLADDGPNRWSQRTGAVEALLKKWPCDFYAFQEANDFQVDFLSQCLPDHGHIGQRIPAPTYWQSNVIFFHRQWHCLRKHHFYLSHTPDIPSKDDDSRWPRQCTIGVFQHHRQHLVCANTHFDFEDTVQKRSARLIINRLNQTGEGCPTLLMGDFNAPHDSGCAAVFRDPDGGKFQHIFDPPYIATHHGFSGQVQLGPAIDWIMYRGNLEKKSAEVITQPFSGFFPSDHFPIVAEMMLLDRNCKQE